MTILTVLADVALKIHVHKQDPNVCIISAGTRGLTRIRIHATHSHHGCRSSLHQFRWGWEGSALQVIHCFPYTKTQETGYDSCFASKPSSEPPTHLNILILGISLHTRFPFLGTGLLEKQNFPLFISALASCEECFML